MNEPVIARLNTLMQLREEVESLSTGGLWEPAADWLETDEQLVLLMDAPGTDASGFDLSEDGDSLTVRGRRLEDGPSGQLIERGRPGPVFERRLRFPREVVAGSGQASLRAGVLTIRFEKRHKTIEHG